MTSATGSPILRAQDRLAGAFGVTPDDRRARVAVLLERSRESSAGYWLQIVVAMGIATLGLALDSTAVVIGAMLVSPLMSPIVELGMGLAVGSPLLVIRSFVRVASSVAVVVAAATVVTMLLPFHDITREIAARVSPTALDLAVAVFCAIAAAYAQMRPTSDTSAMAAGTAIGIALVPPLCVVGYGLGTKAFAVARGAALLFTANFCAIVLFAVVCFVLVGFNRVGVVALEAAELRAHPEGLGARVASQVGRMFATRYGTILRLVMPLLLVAAVYVPLRRALDEVAWEVRARGVVEDIVAELPQKTVHSGLVVKRHTISLRLVTIGTAEDSAALARDLTRRIQAATGVTPTLDVVAVADARALREAVVEPESPPPRPAAPDVETLRAEAGAALSFAWPAAAAGPLVRWQLRVPEQGPPVVEVVHVGAPLGAAGELLLARELERVLEASPHIVDVAYSPAPLPMEARSSLSWRDQVLAAIGALHEGDGVHACVVGPIRATSGGDASSDAASLDDATTDADAATNADASETSNEFDRETLAALQASPAFATHALELFDGPSWELRFVAGSCPPPPPAPTPTPDAAADDVGSAPATDADAHD